MPDMTMAKCAIANCTNPVFVRVGWGENGHPAKEADLCEVCAQDLHERSKGAIAMLGMPSLTFGPPGIPIWPDLPANVIAQSRAAGRDDSAATRDIN